MIKIVLQSKKEQSSELYVDTSYITVEDSKIIIT